MSKLWIFEWWHRRLCLCFHGRMILLLLFVGLMAHSLFGEMAVSKDGSTGPAASRTGTIDELNDAYPLHVGDRIQFRILEDPDATGVLAITDIGEMDIPLVGRVNAANKTCKQLALELKTLLEKKYYRKATVLLELDAMSKSRGKVYVYGQIRSPGIQEILGEKFTVSQAIMRAGGFMESADARKVKVFRKNAKEGRDREMTLDVLDILENGKTRDDIALQDEDYIMVTQQPLVLREKIYVYGQVRTPGPQDSQGGELMLSTAILNAGGFADFANGRKVKVFRKNAKDEKDKELIVDVQEVLKEGRFEKDIALQPGDYVMVPEKLINF